MRLVAVSDSGLELIETTTLALGERCLVRLGTLAEGPHEGRVGVVRPLEAECPGNGRVRTALVTQAESLFVGASARRSRGSRLPALVVPVPVAASRTEIASPRQDAPDSNS